MGRVIRSGEAVLCEDIATYADVIQAREALSAAGIRSLACLPLRVDNTPVGALLCGTRSPTVIAQDEWLLLVELASNLSFALQYLDKQNAVHFLSYFEPLTGLAKRALFCERLTRLQARRSGSPPRLAVTVFDIAHLRVINDSLGRHSGDRLLQCVADRLKTRFPDTEHIAHLGGGTFACVNALRENDTGELRTLHDELMRLFTEPFLPRLESAGLMTAAGTWVIRQAASDCRAWRLQGLPPLRVAVNVSPPELRRRKIADEILECIGDLAGDPDWGVDLEITEGVLSGDASSCVNALRLLRAAGVRIAIDDFGTGFSSLGRLSELPIDTLKIDRSFTSRLPSDRKSGTLVSTIIALARAFDMTTVAEGVENRAQLDYLLREGCDESQGYLHTKPLPRSEFEAWLLRNGGVELGAKSLRSVRG